MELINIEQKKKVIVHEHAFTDKNGKTTSRKDKSPESPYATFREALQALSPIVCFIEGFPKSEHGQVIPKKLTIKRTKQGTKSVSISYNRIYGDLDSEQIKATPYFRIDKPDSGESGDVVLDAAQLKTVVHFMDEAMNYITGGREQLTLDQWREQNTSGVKEGVDADEAQPALVGTEG